MEANKLEMTQVNQVAEKAAEVAIRELTELELVVTGGGNAIAQFG